MLTNIEIYALVAFVFVLLVLVFVNHTSAPVISTGKIIGKVRYVVDGDSLYFHGHEVQIRLWGVDAPEKNEAGFNSAKNALNAFANGQVLTCQIMDTDRYGRVVARCFLKDGQEINRLMIESGAAVEYRRFSNGYYSR